jgi:glycerol kinase
MEADSGIPIRELRVDGGATANNLLMQFQADILGANVVRPKITETTALGAACLAGLATGFWSGQAEIARAWQAEKIFTPAMEKSERAGLLKGWQRAVRAVKAWSEEA